MSRNILELHPKLQAKIQELQSICKAQGLIIGFSEGLRTGAEQDALYAIGRTLPGEIVTCAKGTSYNSQHQWGIAVDFFRNDGKGAFNESGDFFGQVGSIAESIGLGWGGRWVEPVDKPHLYLLDWGEELETLKNQYGTPNAFFESWSKVPTQNQCPHHCVW